MWYLYQWSSLYQCTLGCHCSVCACNLSPALPPSQGKAVNTQLGRVNMSSLSASYSETSTSDTSSSKDESVERGEPSKVPKPKVIIREAKWVLWVPRHDIPIATAAPRQMAPVLPVWGCFICPFLSLCRGPDRSIAAIYRVPSAAVSRILY